GTIRRSERILEIWDALPGYGGAGSLARRQIFTIHSEVVIQRTGRLSVKRVSRFGVLPLAVAGAFALAGCKSGGTETKASNTFRIGVITSLTGAAAAFGQAHKNGYTLALQELNAKGGALGKQIELIYYDDQSKPDQAVQGVAKLVDQDHVPI